MFQHASVPEVVEHMLRKHGLEGADFEFRLERTYPPREVITQWREMDLEFVQRILSEVGIFWFAQMDHASELDVANPVEYQFATTRRTDVSRFGRTENTKSPRVCGTLFISATLDGAIPRWHDHRWGR